jgi:hypothetical protein
VTIAKNYLGEREMQSLERIVTAYLEFAEFQATRQIPMSQADWKKRLDLFPQATGSDLLINADKVMALETFTSESVAVMLWRIAPPTVYWKTRTAISPLSSCSTSM